MSTKNTDKSQMNLKLPADFKKWLDDRSKLKGLDRTSIMLAGVYYLIAMSEADRERVLRYYYEFIDSRCETDKNGLAPLEAAWAKAEKIIPPNPNRTRK